MEKNIRISAVVGIDPGSNGGIVTWRPNHNITAIKMPEDINDIRHFGRYILHNNPGWVRQNLPRNMHERLF